MFGTQEPVEAEVVFRPQASMRNSAVVLVAAWIGALVVVSGAPPGQGPDSRSVPAAGPVPAAVSTYCITCHNDRLRTGGLSLTGLDPQRIRDGADPETWEKVVRRLRTRTMPPVGVPRPDEPTYASLSAWLERELDVASEARPDVGRPLARRLNRAEYANVIRDLLSLEVDAAALLPPDDSSFGFDNIADVLGVSPLLQERHLSAAAKVAAMAVGDTSRVASSETYRARQDLSQNQHIDGLPLGTIGGLLARHTFPLDGEYELKVTLQHTNFGNVRGLDYPTEVETTIDGERVHTASIGGAKDLAMMFEHPQNGSDAVEARLTARVTVKAGTRPVTVAFVRNLEVGDSRRIQQFLRSSVDTLDWTGLPHIQSLTIRGPFGTIAPGDTPSRRRVFTCRPVRTDQEEACARQILTTLARRAYRRPVADADVRPLLALFREARRDGTFEAGIQVGLQAVLSSPRFLFRVESDPAPSTGAARAPFPVSDVDLASRLSFFLWSSIPDDELLAEASAGRLRTPAQVERQVRRMLADPWASALVANFAGQWLQLRNVRNVLPNSDEFPDFDDNLRQAMHRETELLFQSVMREDRSVLDLLRADYTFLNERLARHYGVPGIYGSHFRRVPVTTDARRGLLGHGSILALTSHAERTSPVVRGKWVLENLLGTPPPPPPPDVPTLMENAAGRAPKTLRARMTEHRANPTCAACHKVMDPIGFALENFDAVGAWRTEEPGGSIDAAGELADGSKVDGVPALREAILRRPDVFVTTATEKLLTYALGRGIDYRDRRAVRAVVRQAESSGYKFSALVQGVVASKPFRMRMPDQPSQDSTRSSR